MKRTVTEIGGTSHGLSYTEDVEVSALQGEAAETFYKKQILNFVEMANELQLSRLYSFIETHYR